MKLSFASYNAQKYNLRRWFTKSGESASEKIKIVEEEMVQR
jgi:hypothetical protein